MLKPVSILALDDVCTPLADAVQRRIATVTELDDLAQARACGGGSDLAAAIESIHARRQAPDSPLRARDDVSTREIVLLLLGASGPARTSVLAAAAEVRRLYETRRFAPFHTIEILCLLPDVFASSTPADYGAAYDLLKAASATDPQPFSAMWLLSSQNGRRVKFPPIEEALDTYAQAIAGALTYEPELSGALPGAFRPRGMDATFSSFGFAELVFPRDAALRRLEPRLAAELVRTKLLQAGAASTSPQLAAKQFVSCEELSAPLSRIGVDAGQSLFTRFQPKTFVTEKTRTADEVIAAVRAELKVHRDTIHVANLQALAAQGEKTAVELSALLSRTVDDVLDRESYASGVSLSEALLDPLPDLRGDGSLAPRNLVTEINAATAALDARVRFAPNTAASVAMRKRVRELEMLLHDQKLVAETLAPAHAADQLAAMEQEKDDLMRQLPDLLFAEEAENNAGRSAARDAEAARLAQETEAKEQQLRDLFAARPRAEQVLRELLDERHAFIWRQIFVALFAVVTIYGVPIVIGKLQGNLRPISWTAAGAVVLIGVVALIRYFSGIAPRLRIARDNLEQINEHINATDRAKNNAHNDELQFEYDVAHRKATISVLRRTREAAKSTLEALRVRVGELEDLAASFAPASTASLGLSIAVVDDEDIDGWYERTADDRKPLVREFPIKRSESRHLPLEELRRRIAAYTAGGFDAFRRLTIAQAAAIASEEKTERRLRRFADHTAPLIDVRDDDIEAERAMQRDVTLWADAADAVFVERIRRRIPTAGVKTPRDLLRIQALSRILHYPAYVLGQIDYYREQAGASDHELLPLPAPIRDAYEQLLLGRAVGVLRLCDDGGIARAATDAVLGDSPFAAAQRLASSETLRAELDSEIAPRLSVAGDVERDLRQLLDAAPPLSAFERGVVGGLLKRYGL